MHAAKISVELDGWDKFCEVWIEAHLCYKSVSAMVKGSKTMVDIYLVSRDRV